MPQVRKAELIEGVVYMPSPVRVQHAYHHGLVATWMGTYQAATPGVQMLIQPSIRLDLDNEPQPDVILRRTKGGSSSISADNYVEGSPELVVEIASSSVSIDLHRKLNVYRRNGVQKYLVWEVDEPSLTWFNLQKGQYYPLDQDEEDIICSQVFPGLWIKTSALLTQDLALVLRTLYRGLESADHRDFVVSLSTAD
jgi:Uma2 family endonuclease